MSLDIGTPKSQGLNADQHYLPTMVQDVLADSISKYSAVKVLDHVSLDRVFVETLDTDTTRWLQRDIGLLKNYGSFERFK